MSQQERTSRMAVLLFTDMVDSVALERQLGTEAYSRLLKQHHRLFLQVLEQGHGGEVRNDTGDGMLCEFGTAAGAVNAALLFQMLLRETDWEKEAPKVRIGIHQGQLAEFQMNTAGPGKLVGMPVNIAARVMSLAQAGQILMTRAVYDDARQFVRQHPVARAGGAPPPALRWKAHGNYSFKGSEDSVEVFEVGADGFAPLTAPPSTDKARSAAIPRPAPVRALAPVLTRVVARKRSPIVGAALTAVCGLVLWKTTLGESWVNASYDTLFRFPPRTSTNDVVVILMDNDAYDKFGQTRDQPWDRALHARLLNKLADDDCQLVVMDIRLRRPGDTEKDQALTTAMGRLKNVVLAAQQSGATHPDLVSAGATPPLEKFLTAARTNWGVAWLDPDRDLIVRRHWPFPNPGPYASLPWAAAELLVGKLNETPEERWIRYYGNSSAGTELGYDQALGKSPKFFHDKIVFVGNKPGNTLADKEEDEFCTPYFNWTSETAGGVEILATSFLNLVNGDWLRRPAWPVEGLLFIATGALLVGALCRFRRHTAFGLALVAALFFTVAGVYLSYFTNFWFPWLIIAGGQVPCALAWAIVTAKIEAEPQAEPQAAVEKPSPDKTIRLSFPEEQLPDAPEYELITPHIGEGGYGKVWIVRNAIGQWQALKAVYQAKFGENRGPYEAEFKGLQRYKPVSEKHPGLLRIDLVSKMKSEGYFYYVMELGDAQVPGWEKQPALYKPRDLENLRKQAEGRRLPPAECLRIVTVLADALDFLHQQSLTHRDIKPSNVIFVNGRPKLADVGLVADIRPLDQVHTLVGTLGYMPPPPEKPGTTQADIYALGMLLYVISAGRDPGFFPDLSTTLMERSGHAEFIELNAIVLKACQPDVARRYQTTSEMLRDLQTASKALGLNSTPHTKPQVGYDGPRTMA